MELIQYYQYLQSRQPTEAAALAVFGAGLSAFYALTAATVLSLFLTNRRRHSQLTKARFSTLQYVMLSLGAAGIICHVYAFFIEPNWIDVSHIPLRTDKIRPGSRPIRIVQISDLHCESGAGAERYLPDLIRREKPDLIVFTGDAINTREAIGTFKTCMKQVSAIAPTFGVTGNHDAFEFADLNVFGGTGVRQLNMNAVPLAVAGNEIWIAGVGCDHQGWNEALNMVPKKSYTLFLDHYSDQIYNVSGLHADLYLSGHTHGGQIALPFYGALATFAQYGKTFESGLYAVNGTWLYVNRGIGMDGGSFPRARFCARPEVTVFEISSG